MKNTLTVLLLGLLFCGCSQKQTDLTSGRALTGKTTLVYCWFVEDNGCGNKGYVFISSKMGRAMTPSEPLYSTIRELRVALKRIECDLLYLIPKQPGWVPESWKVRNLSSNEVTQLGSSLKLTILKE